MDKATFISVIIACLTYRFNEVVNGVSKNLEAADEAYFRNGISVEAFAETFFNTVNPLLENFNPKLEDASEADKRVHQMAYDTPLLQEAAKMYEDENYKKFRAFESFLNQNFDGILAEYMTKDAGMGEIAHKAMEADKARRMRENPLAELLGGLKGERGIGILDDLMNMLGKDGETPSVGGCITVSDPTHSAYGEHGHITRFESDDEPLDIIIDGAGRNKPNAQTYTVQLTQIKPGHISVVDVSETVN